MVTSDDVESLDPAEHLARQRDALRARAATLDEDMASLVIAAQGSNADDEHDPEGATIAYERAQLAAMIQQTRTHLDEIEEASARVCAGTFGNCEVCGQPIPAARLEARPTARTCVRHAPGGSRR